LSGCKEGNIVTRKRAYPLCTKNLDVLSKIRGTIGEVGGKKNSLGERKKNCVAYNKKENPSDKEERKKKAF